MLATITAPTAGCHETAVDPTGRHDPGEADDFDVFRALEQDGAQLACWTADPDLFFAESPADVERAKSLCAGCPAATACLRGALERREVYGVWGGQLVIQGTVVPRKRPRGRPRKNPLPEPALV